MNPSDAKPAGEEINIAHSPSRITGVRRSGTDEQGGVILWW
jgi:hypothetical protein